MKHWTLILVMIGLMTPAHPAVGDEGNPRWIQIPALDISQAVVTVAYDGYQWDTSPLKAGIGTLEYLDWMDGGNTVLVGHTPGAFSDLDKLAIGDVIYIYDAAEVFKFAVGEIFTVEETALYIYYSTETQRLTLFTCYGRVDKTGRYLDRLVVVAYPSP